MMREYLCLTAEFLTLFPSMLLAYMPMGRQLRLNKKKLVMIAVPLMILISFICSVVCWLLRLKAIWIQVPGSIIVGILYTHSLDETRWKTTSVFLAICASFSSLRSIIEAVDVWICPENEGPWLSVGGAVIYNLVCWLFAAASWYPATRFAKKLLDDEAFAETWYVFWCLPLLFIGLNLFLRPIHPELLSAGRAMQLYLITQVALLALLLLFYVMFYWAATSLNKNYHLRQENQFLAMQQTQYQNLRTAIAETRESRHDLRHHFSVLSGLAQRKEWAKLEDYLSQVQETIPDTELNLCENTAVDSVVSHYALLFRKNGIPFSFRLELPQELPVSEMDIGLVLSNLLENALDASLHTGIERRNVRVQASLHSSHIVLVTVENAFDGTVREKEGIFLSSKRPGEGVGISSVQHIAEKCGGYSRFTYVDGVFCANVMLRGV